MMNNEQCISCGGGVQPLTPIGSLSTTCPCPKHPVLKVLNERSSSKLSEISSNQIRARQGG